MDKAKFYTILQYVIIGLLVVVSIYQFYQNRQLNAQLGNAIIEMNKIGESIKISENLWRTTAAINEEKLNNLVNSSDAIKKLIAERNERILSGTGFKTNTLIENVSIPTTTTDSNSQYRTASYKEPNGYWEFLAKYQIQKPFNFSLEKLSLNDSYKIIQTKQPSGRISVYVENTNPFVHIDSAFTFIDPILITQTKESIVYKSAWQYQFSALVNPNSKNTDIHAGIYAPFGLGIIAGYSIYKDKEFIPNIGDNFKIGISFLKDIK
jgi:hypothetical protein